MKRLALLLALGVAAAAAAAQPTAAADVSIVVVNGGRLTGTTLSGLDFDWGDGVHYVTCDQAAITATYANQIRGAYPSHWRRT